MKYFAATLACALAAICSTTAATAPLKLDFEIHGGKSQNRLPSIQKRGTTRGDVSLNLANNVFMYVATVEVGSQRNQISVQIDTGSSDLWFMSSNVECFVPPNVQSRSLEGEEEGEVDEIYEFDKRDSTTTSYYYQPIPSGVYYPGGNLGNASTTGTAAGDIAETNTCTAYGSLATGESITFKTNYTAPEFSILYEDLTGAEGVWGQDSISFGGATVEHVSIGVANESTTNLGIFGIGLSGNEATNEGPSAYTYDNVPVLLKQQGIINKELYSLYLNDIDATSGSVLFGAIDHAKYSGELKTLPLVNPVLDPEFTVRLDSITLVDGEANTTFSNSPYVALLDSGTSLIYLPQKIYDSIVNYFGGAVYSPSEGFYEVTCPANYNKTVDFTFSGFTLKVPFTEFILFDNSSPATQGKCYLGFMNNGKDPLIILGDVVLRSAYVVYDLEDYTVSIGQARYTNEEDIEIIGAATTSSSSISSSASSTSSTASSYSVAASTISSSFVSLESSVSFSSSPLASAVWSNSSSVSPSSTTSGLGSLSSKSPLTSTSGAPSEATTGSHRTTTGSHRTTTGAVAVTSGAVFVPVEEISTVTDETEDTVTVPCPKCTHVASSVVLSKAAEATSGSPGSGSPGSGSPEAATSGYTSESGPTWTISAPGSTITFGTTSTVGVDYVSESSSTSKGSPSVPQVNAASNPLSKIFISALAGVLLPIVLI